MAFEKACILFNLGAIYTQIGAKQDRSLEKGLDAAVDNFLRAAGVFRHIFDTFTNAPSMDLKPQVGCNRRPGGPRSRLRSLRLLSVPRCSRCWWH